MTGLWGQARRVGSSLLLLALVALGGCARPLETVDSHGRVILTMRAPARQAQYVANDLQCFRVTVRDVTSAAAFVQVLPSQPGGRLQFGALNLPVGQYEASVEAFADAAALMPAGLSRSAPFSVTPGAEVAVSLPPLVLAPTPSGDWNIRANVSLASGFSLVECRFTLSAASGGTQAATLPTTELTWGQVPAFPAGVSTTSLQVTAKKGKTVVTKTAVLSGAIAPGATVSSTVTLALP